MELVNCNIEKYSEQHSSPVDKVLKELIRETNIKILRPRMLSGETQGKFLELLVKMTGARRILEIGTYTGFSAICMANGLGKNGHLHTIDVNDELESIIKKYISKSGMENKITSHIGNAIDIIPTIDEEFDFVFIDADKTNYLNYYNLLIDRIPSGAIIIADNVLWSGKILDIPEEKDKDTKALQIFNDFVQNDDRVENALLTIRDGLLVVRKL